MARRIGGIFVVSVLAAVVLATPAFASGGAVQATDPSANSPAGVVYQIPLDSARQDASPHRTGGSGSGNSGSGGSSTGGAVGGGSGAGGGGGPSSGAGASSSTVSSSGTGSSTASGAHSYLGSKVPVLVPGGQPGSLIHSSNGFGSSSQVPSLDGAPASAGLGAVQSNASSAPLLAFLLAALVLLLGGYVGLRAWRFPRRALHGDVLPPTEPPQLPSGRP